MHFVVTNYEILQRLELDRCTGTPICTGRYDDVADDILYQIGKIPPIYSMSAIFALKSRYAGFLHSVRRPKLLLRLWFNWHKLSVLLLMTRSPPIASSLVRNIRTAAQSSQ